MKLHFLARCWVSSDHLEFAKLLIATADHYEVIASILEDSFETLVTQNACPITAATFLSILADLFAILFISNSESCMYMLHLVHTEDYCRREN